MISRLVTENKCDKADMLIALLLINELARGADSNAM